ncbi:MAG: hypothetical protein ACI8O8_000234 [Oleiphilaceae bacterium]|jgi:hypothetical protein
MAKSYLEEGLSGGSKLMSSFDEDANNINEQVNKLIERISLKLNLGIKNDIHEADAEIILLIIFALLFLALLVCLVIANKLVISTPMSKLADIIKSMASQQKETGSNNVNTDHLNKDIKTELGAIAYWLSDLLSAINEQNLETMALANNNKRVKQGLDAYSTNVMPARLTETFKKSLKSALEHLASWRRPI